MRKLTIERSGREREREKGSWEKKCRISEGKSVELARGLLILVAFTVVKNWFPAKMSN